MLHLKGNFFTQASSFYGISKYGSYLETYMSEIVKWHLQNLCSLGEICENPSWKLENISVYLDDATMQQCNDTKLMCSDMHKGG